MGSRIKYFNDSYFNSTLAPAASNFFFASSASFFATPFFTSLGAPSTKSLASFKPKPVIDLTSFITLIFLSPADAKKIVKSLFSSAGAAPPAAGAAATGAAAAFACAKGEAALAAAVADLGESL